MEMIFFNYNYYLLFNPYWEINFATRKSILSWIIVSFSSMQPHAFKNQSGNLSGYIIVLYLPCVIIKIIIDNEYWFLLACSLDTYGCELKDQIQ